MLTYTERMAQKLGFSGGSVKAFDGFTKTGRAAYKVVASNADSAPPPLTGKEKDLRKWANDEDTQVKARKVVTSALADGSFLTEGKVAITGEALVADILECRENAKIVETENAPAQPAERETSEKNGKTVKV